MVDWTLGLVTPHGACGNACSVFDALGQRLGRIAGWVYPPEGPAAFVLVEVAGVGALARFVVPLGYLAQVDVRRRRIYLREVTRARLRRRGLRLEDDQPTDDALSDAVREAPSVRPGLLNRLAELTEGPGDGHRLPAPPDLAPPPATWTPLIPITTPAWTRLADLRSPASPPFRGLKLQG